MTKKPAKENIYSTCLSSPVGKLRLVASDKGLMLLCFQEFEKDWAPHFAEIGDIKKSGKTNKVLSTAVKSVKKYFAGDTKALDKIRIAPLGSEFQQDVWREMRKVRAGQVTSYGELAKKAGSPNAARAVGSACRNNPIAIISPCHRILAANGKLNAYRGGLKRKRFLLEHEGVRVGG